MLTTDSKELKAASIAVKTLSKKVPKAINSAFRHTGQRLQTAAIQEVRKEYVLKAGDVKKYGNMRLKYGTGEITLKSVGRNIPLIKFRTTPTRVVKRKPKVLKAAVKRGEKKPILGAFVQRMGNGNTGVYRRLGKTRLPIGQLYGPAVPVMLNSAEIRTKLQAEMDQRLEKRLEHELNRINREVGFR
ncbi:phage tail protein [Paenibacillus sp.]|uniref:phage tail protein n=1 Tax=Paenibacillus sp. TaxID=58172 RepID=UPI003464AF37